MLLEDFKNILEVQSLDKQIQKHLSVIEDENKRLQVVSANKDRRAKEKVALEETLSNLSHENSQLEKELFTLEKELNKAKEHLGMATSAQQVSALEKEISNLSPRVEEIESKILENLDVEEKTQEELDKAKTYFSAIDETIAEIQNEINQVASQEQTEISKYNERITLLLENLSQDTREIYFKAREKHRFNHPATPIMGSGCGVCKYQIPAITRSQVERSEVLEFCPGCSRLLVPLNAKL